MAETFLNGLVALKYVETARDEISYFDTIQTIEAPLCKYLDEILATDEWGEICIHYNHNYFTIEYSHGVYKTKPYIISTITDKIVKRASYKGGWSRGDWKLEVNDEQADC